MVLSTITIHSTRTVTPRRLLHFQNSLLRRLKAARVEQLSNPRRFATNRLDQHALPAWPRLAAGNYHHLAPTRSREQPLLESSV